MSDPFVGEVRIFTGNFPPTGWAFCDGQLLPISQNTALFSLLGTTYGGDGRTTFALPNLQGAMPMGPGNGPGLTPRALGGQTTWENVVTACAPCNLRKGSKLPKQAGMFPHQKPYRPTVQDLHNNGRLFPPNYLHESWLDYLYWDTELQP